jgi:glycerate-2-kinase
VSATNIRALLRRMFDAAIAAAQPALCVPRHLPAAPTGRLVVIGAGRHLRRWAVRSRTNGRDRPAAWSSHATAPMR